MLIPAVPAGIGNLRTAETADTTDKTSKTVGTRQEPVDDMKKDGRVTKKGGESSMRWLNMHDSTKSEVRPESGPGSRVSPRKCVRQIEESRLKVK